MILGGFSTGSMKKYCMWQLQYRLWYGVVKNNSTQKNPLIDIKSALSSVRMCCEVYLLKALCLLSFCFLLFTIKQTSDPYTTGMRQTERDPFRPSSHSYPHWDKRLCDDSKTTLDAANSKLKFSCKTVTIFSWLIYSQRASELTNYRLKVGSFIPSLGSSWHLVSLTRHVLFPTGSFAHVVATEMPNMRATEITPRQNVQYQSQ